MSPLFFYFSWWWRKGEKHNPMPFNVFCSSALSIWYDRMLREQAGRFLPDTHLCTPSHHTSLSRTVTRDQTENQPDIHHFHLEIDKANRRLSWSCWSDGRSTGWRIRIAPIWSSVLSRLQSIDWSFRSEWKIHHYTSVCEHSQRVERFWPSRDTGSLPPAEEDENLIQSDSTVFSLMGPWLRIHQPSRTWKGLDGRDSVEGHQLVVEPAPQQPQATGYKSNTDKRTASCRKLISTVANRSLIYSCCQGKNQSRTDSCLLLCHWDPLDH